MSATIHFYIRSERPHNDGSAQIYMLFTINRKLKTKISLKKSVPLKKEFKHLALKDIMNLNSEIREDIFCWDKEKQLVTKDATNASKINHLIISKRNEANDIIFKHELMNKPLTIEGFIHAFCKPTGHQTFSEYFMEEFNLRGHKWSEETLRSYRSIVTKIQQFKSNLTLNDINHKFLIEYENYMLKPIEQKGCGNSERTVANNMKVLKTLILIAVKNGDFLKENHPFEDYKISDTAKELTSRDYLEPTELKILEGFYDGYVAIEKPLHKLSPQEWQERTDNKLLSPGEHCALKRFLFSCYTGLRFKDMLALQRESILSKTIELPDNGGEVTKYYIELSMHKTGRKVIIPLIDKALLLIDLEKSGKVFESITNQQVNKHLKTIKKISEISKHLTFHVSRHSFATICFLYGIPEKVGQNLLGHKNRKFTEIYTHLTSNRLFFEMEKLNTALNQNTQLIEEDENKKDADLIALIPDLKNLSPDKLSKIKELIRLIA